MKHSLLILVITLLAVVSCKEDTLPKPKAMLRLEYPKGEYESYKNACNFSLDVNQSAVLKQKEDCSIVIDYPLMKGSIYITYKNVDNNIRDLLIDTQKLTYEHVSKADNIESKEYIDATKSVYGMYYDVTGNAASPAQFYVTDSINHFVAGSLYFYAKPNYDSIYPAANYLQQDIRRIMESITWE